MAYKMKFDKPTLVLNYSVYAKMFHYTKAAKGEVSGFGEIEIDDSGPVAVGRVKSAFILPQKCTGAYTEIDEETIGDFLFHCAKSGKDPSRYRFWWHSHASFGVFFSGVDEDNITSITQNGSWFSLCMNKQGNMVARYDGNGRKEFVSIFINPTASSHLGPVCRRQTKRLVGAWTSFASLVGLNRGAKRKTTRSSDR